MASPPEPLHPVEEEEKEQKEENEQKEEKEEKEEEEEEEEEEVSWTLIARFRVNEEEWANRIIVGVRVEGETSEWNTL